ncbi:hypothetical protein L1987_33607 [Smallanthus sonchifolius]|uniref:Uncharacterized protein n=1 Tax=Smallanthus sonchifolius TaxID=185202 RepID=A0ACB9HS68_9ASTR|nr:hypothetical protein L1987_33607 [Smallanthus sonchifolius]
MSPRRAKRHTNAETQNNVTNDSTVNRNEIAQSIAEQIVAAIPKIVAQLTPNGNSGVIDGTNGNGGTNRATDTNGTEGHHGTTGGDVD